MIEWRNAYAARSEMQMDKQNDEGKRNAGKINRHRHTQISKASNLMKTLLGMDNPAA
jgi:hypothetical protein